MLFLNISIWDVGPLIVRFVLSGDPCGRLIYPIKSRSAFYPGAARQSCIDVINVIPDSRFARMGALPCGGG